ncbi:MAG: ATP phosphoribosyltransferase regulatory subunit [Clostridiaceae bacterium]|nr:ATP phosphoribosyltransferase regulatory subunit [Clostridiales bacterium]MDD6878194.1 ATP phosphoribosyltransferase regulatory subunit [Clostridiaceae bacterium]MDY3287269.1 ATP phosphoribosyltransferase regulatory subunit [Eubacteriales bacterium]MDY5015801.1 ATP phosphoribosyltransferase regulatory subunit [Eubacteriales bacterium]
MAIFATPAGTRDRLFSDCARRRETENKLARCFYARGYREIETPALEYYDTLVRSGNPVTQEELFILPERRGRLCALRPDMTTPIARVAASKVDCSVPRRFYYLQDVFRASGMPGRVQVRQAGVELIGAAGLRADTEVIALAAEALSTTGMYRIEIGHAGFFRKLARALGAGEDFVEELRALVNRKNFASLPDLLSEYRESPAYRALCRLPQLFGGEEVLDEAFALADGCVGTEELDTLRAIYRELQAAGFGPNIMLDLGLVHHMDYYTGVVFRGYVAGAGTPVLQGGRYDSLLGCLGHPAPATGFAADVDALTELRADEETEDDIRFVVHVGTGALRRAMDYCDSRPGQCVCSPYESEAESRELAGKLSAKLVVIE